MLLNIINIYMFIGLVTNIFLMAYIVLNGKPLYMKFFAILQGTIIVYMFGYMIELNSHSLENLLFWNQFQYLTLPFINAIWLILGLLYTGSVQKINVTKILIIFIIPIITFVLRITNSIHYLYYKSYYIVEKYGIEFLVINKGPWYLVQITYLFIATFITIYVFYKAYKGSCSSDKIKFKIMTISGLLPLISTVLTAIDPYKSGVDYSVLILPVVVLLMTYSVVRYDFLEVKSLARNELFINSDTAMFILNKDMKIMDYNTEAVKTFQLHKIDLGPLKLSCYKDIIPKFYESLIHEGDQIYEYSSNKYFEIITKELTNNTKEVYGYLKTIRDITKGIKYSKKMELIAKTDFLSQLNNRREFINQGAILLKDAAIKQYPINMLMIDIDHFKKVNDQYGHIIGDEVIVKIGEILKRKFRNEDLIARMGGEEFAVLLVNLDYKASEIRAKELIRTIEEASLISSNTSHIVTVSIGLAEDDGTYDLERLTKNADEALYLSKDNGRNRVTVYKN